MSNEILLEGEFIVLSAETINKLFQKDNGSDLVALYLFYHKQCKLQKTNQSFTISTFAMQGLHWGDKRFKDAKRVLKELDLIEDICDKDEHGKIKGWYVRIKYMKSSGAENHKCGNTPSGFQKTNAGSSKTVNAGSSKTVNALITTEVVSDKSEIVTYGNQDINKILDSLLKSVGCDTFKEAKEMQRYFGKHLLGLLEKIGKEEFMTRLKGVLSDPFKRKNSNSIKYLYGELKSYIREGEGVKLKEDESRPKSYSF